jgi:hypothetical protein
MSRWSTHRATLRLSVVVGLALLAIILSSCGSDELVDTTLSPDSATTTTPTVTTAAIEPTTTDTAERTPTTTRAPTTLTSRPTGDEAEPEDVMTVPDNPALKPDAWLGVVYRGDMEGVVPAGFESTGGKCVGDLEAEDACTLALDFARSVDDPDTEMEEWLILLGRFRSRDSAGIPEWEVVDALYVGFPEGHDLHLFTSECWSWYGFGVAIGGWASCSPPVTLLRAWQVDWHNETITEVEVNDNVFCQQECP